MSVLLETKGEDCSLEKLAGSCQVESIGAWDWSDSNPVSPMEQPWDGREDTWCVQAPAPCVEQACSWRRLPQRAFGGLQDSIQASTQHRALCVAEHSWLIILFRCFFQRLPYAYIDLNIGPLTRRQSTCRNPPLLPSPELALAWGVRRKGLTVMPLDMGGLAPGENWEHWGEIRGWWGKRTFDLAR